MREAERRTEENSRRELKIAMFGHKRIPSREGGVEVVVEELSIRMVEKGCSVTCYNRKGHHVSGKKFDVEEQKEYMGVKLKKVLTIPYRGFAAMSSSFFAAVFCSFGKYDIVHIHAEGPAFWCFLPKLFGKRVIVTVHGLDHQRAKWGRVASAYIMMGEKNAVRFADEIIVLSSVVQQYFMGRYNRKTTFIPNGVNSPAVRPAKWITEKWQLKKNEYILYLGRVVPEKGGKYLIEAFRKIKTDKRLVIAGGSSDTQGFMEELINLAGGDERILFTGFVQGEILEELYSNAYLYCLPSDLEGMPLSLLEAMSYGNCCLVSDIPECAEVIEDKGVLFKRGDTEDLKNKLQMLCDHSEVVKKYREEAGEFILKKYDWGDLTEQILHLYKNY